MSESIVQYFYSPSTKGFYISDANSYIPQDVIEITKEYWKELLDGQSQGNEIKPNENGYPILINPLTNKNYCIELFTSNIQIELNSYAQTWGYDDMVSAVSYANSQNTQYSADAIALINWRDAVWGWAYTKFLNIVIGETWEQFSVDMPLKPEKPIL